MIATDLLQMKFEQGLSYADLVASGEPEGHHTSNWHDRYGRLALSPEQQKLIAGFTREMNVLCLTGTWCGDCALQGSAIARIAEANPRICTCVISCPRPMNMPIFWCPPASTGASRVPVTWFPGRGL